MQVSHRAVLAVVSAVFLCGYLACTDKSSGQTTTEPTIPGDGEVATALHTLATKAIYFGHQSVGYNIMDGVHALLTGVTGAVPTIRETSDPGAIETGTFAHASNGSNGDPMGKTAAFVATINGGVGSRVQIAFFKYCYVDFDGSTDVNAVFADYQTQMAALKAAYPGVRFVHMTVPLETGATSNNAVRERFSALVRQAYGSSEPLFDLAKVESTKPDGSTEMHGGVRSLVDDYSSDGGHLNGTGQEVVSKALVVYLAAL